jgi:hypothetical protein
MAVVSNTDHAEDIMSILFDQRGDDTHLTEDILIAAAEVASPNSDLIPLLLDRQSEKVDIT